MRCMRCLDATGCSRPSTSHPTHLLTPLPFPPPAHLWQAREYRGPSIAKQLHAMLQQLLARGNIMRHQWRMAPKLTNLLDHPVYKVVYRQVLRKYVPSRSNPFPQVRRRDGGGKCEACMYTGTHWLNFSDHPPICQAQGQAPQHASKEPTFQADAFAAMCWNNLQSTCSRFGCTTGRGG